VILCLDIFAIIFSIQYNSFHLHFDYYSKKTKTKKKKIHCLSWSFLFCCFSLSLPSFFFS